MNVNVILSTSSHNSLSLPATDARIKDRTIKTRIIVKNSFIGIKPISHNMMTKNIPR